MPKIIAPFISLIILSSILGCNPSMTEEPSVSTDTPSPVQDLVSTVTMTALPTLVSTPTIIQSPTITLTPTEDGRLKPQVWESWPIVPAMTSRVEEIYQVGLKMGVQPETFTVVGDCQSHAEQFMGVYATTTYDLGSAQYLQETIDAFTESISHQSLAVRNGLSAPSALSPLWADSSVCNPVEGPLECELRVYRPMIVFIALGRNWHPAAPISRFEESMRLILDMIITQGAIPVIINKNDNVEGNWSVNKTLAQVAFDYNIPLINFWKAAGKLPNNGLLDNFYMTYEAIDLRSFYALKTMDRLWRDLTNQ